jgi:site-specific recombinase XerD
VARTHKADFTNTEGRGGGPPLKHLVLDHLEDLEIAGRSAITAKRYGAYLDTFLEWLAFQSKRAVAELTAADVTDERLRLYRLFLSRRRDPQTGRPIVASTRNLYLIALRGFLTYLTRRRRIAVPDPEDTLDLAKERDVEIRYLGREEVDRIREAIDLAKPNGLRDRAMLEVLFGTGVRVSELAALTIRQVDLARREAEVIGKGGRSRLVLLTEEAAGWLERYLETRSDDHPAMFVRAHLKELRPLSVRRIQKILDEAAKRAGIPFRVSPHMLRHSRLTILARHAGVQAAQRIAGHSSLATTSRYLHVTDTQLRSAYDAAEKADRTGR